MVSSVSIKKIRVIVSLNDAAVELSYLVGLEFHGTLIAATDIANLQRLSQVT